MINESTIRAAFAVLSAAGHKLPAAFGQDDGLDQAVLVYTAALRQLTPAELEQAVGEWVSRPTQWWPTTGQLLDLVDGRGRNPQLPQKPEPRWFIRTDPLQTDENPLREGAWWEGATVGDAIAQFLVIDKIWESEPPASVLVTPQGGVEARVDLEGAAT